MSGRHSFSELTMDFTPERRRRIDDMKRELLAEMPLHELLAFMGHALRENGNGLLMDFVVSGATGTAERDAMPGLLDDARQRGSVPGHWEVTGATTRGSV